MTKISILGLEGTAWNLSAAIVDDKDVIAETTATYKPATGGIHPREAAQHHANHIAEVVNETLKKGGRLGRIYATPEQMEAFNTLPDNIRNALQFLITDKKAPIPDTWLETIKNYLSGLARY